jgi:hypothetical protein
MPGIDTITRPRNPSYTTPRDSPLRRRQIRLSPNDSGYPPTTLRDGSEPLGQGTKPTLFAKTQPMRHAGLGLVVRLVRRPSRMPWILGTWGGQNLIAEVRAGIKPGYCQGIPLIGNRGGG